MIILLFPIIGLYTHAYLGVSFDFSFVKFGSKGVWINNHYKDEEWDGLNWHYRPYFYLSLILSALTLLLLTFFTLHSH